jgi:hypothetical protein
MVRNGESWEFRPCTPETARRNYEENLREFVAGLVSSNQQDSQNGGSSVESESSESESDESQKDESKNSMERDISSEERGVETFGVGTDVMQEALKERGYVLRSISRGDSDDEDEQECFRKDLMSKKFLKTSMTSDAPSAFFH